MDLEAESRVVAERVDQFLAERPELKEAVDRLPYTEPEASEGAPNAPEGPPAELPSSAAVLQDLEDFLKSLRHENGGSASDT